MVDGGCADTDHPSTVTQPRSEVFDFDPRSRFSQFLRRSVPPRHQFVWLVLQADHPVITHASMKTFRLKGEDVPTKRLLHSTIPTLRAFMNAANDGPSVAECYRRSIMDGREGEANECENGLGSHLWAR